MTAPRRLNFSTDDFDPPGLAVEGVVRGVLDRPATKVSDIPDHLALWCCAVDAGALARLVDAAAAPMKVALRKLEQLDRRNLIEWGVSINHPWLTRAGWALLGIDREEGGWEPTLGSPP